MYLCTSIIQYIVTYRHKKLRKFDKKNTGFSRPAKDFHLFNCQRTVLPPLLPHAAIGTIIPAARATLNAFFKPFFILPTSFLNKGNIILSFLTVKKGKNSTTSINTLFVEFFY